MSTTHGTLCDRLPAAPIEESNTTSSESSSVVPPSSDPELNNALLDNEKVVQEDPVVSDGIVPYIFDPLFGFPLIPLPQPTTFLPQSSDLPSQWRLQSSSDATQPLTSITNGTTSESSHVADSTTTLSRSSMSVLPSSSDPELNDALHALTSCVKDHQENSEKSDGMDDNIFNLFFPSVPLPQIIERMPPHEMSSKDQDVDTSQLSKSTAHSHSSSLDCLPLPNVPASSTDIPISLTLPPAAYSCSVARGTILPAGPIEESNITLSQSSGCVPPSSTYSSDPELNNVVCALLDDKSSSKESVETCSDYVDPYIVDLLFQVPLIPLPPTTDPPPQELSLPASKEQGVTDTQQCTTSTAHSQSSSIHVDSSSTTEKTAPGMESLPILDLFSLIPLPYPTNSLPQVMSQSASREQGVDTLKLTTPTAPPHDLPVEQTTNVRRKMDTPSLCAPGSHSFVDDNEDNLSVHMYTNPADPSRSQEESNQGGTSSILGEQSIGSSFTSTFSTSETAAQMEADSNVEVQDSTNKPKEVVRVVQQQRQRMLNKVRALRYRKSKKERRSDLEVRKEQLEAENAGLKEQVTVLTTEIAKLKRLSKTQKAKFCPFFLQSSCKKIK